MIIPEVFWKKLRAKMRISINNPEYVDVFFRSTKESIVQALHRITLKNPLGGNEWVIVGNYDTIDGSIQFNIGVDDIPKEELARVLVHEFVHKIQDEAGKFPKMGKTKILNKDGYDDTSPWEVEAYRLQEELYEFFLQYCEII